MNPYIKIIFLSISIYLVSNLETFSSEVTGSGATFPFPLYSKWIDAYKDETGFKVSYSPIGSRAGIKQITSAMTTFGGSDMPLSKEELDKAGLVQFPIAMAGDVPIVNIKEIKSGDLVLDGPTLAKIYLGQVVKWDDPSIRKLNPNLILPSIPIIVIRRADGSGTSFIWTDYLSKVSEVWERTVGSGTEVNWPIGIGGIGNDGVMKNVQNFRGSIGYVEFAYARRNNLNSVSVINKEGKVVLPNFDSFSAAAANVNWKSLNRYFVLLTNQPGEQTWPISGATFILMQKRLMNFDDTVSALKFFLWAYNHGETYARELNYAPMPAKAISEIKATWKSEFPSEVIKAINLN